MIEADQRQIDQHEIERFHRLALPLLGEVFTLARYLAPDAAAAEAATQETFLRAWHDFACRPDHGVKSWLVTMLCQVLRSAPRGDARRDDPSSAGDPSSVWEEPAADEASAIASPNAADLRRSIFGLPAASRETLILKELGRLSYREIADVTGVAVVTVMSRLALARKALQPRSGQ